MSCKYFIGYNDNDDIRSLCIKLPQMIRYAKYFDSNKTISFKVIDKKTVTKKLYTKISKKKKKKIAVLSINNLITSLVMVILMNT